MIMRAPAPSTVQHAYARRAAIHTPSVPPHPTPPPPPPLHRHHHTAAPHDLQSMYLDDGGTPIKSGRPTPRAFDEAGVPISGGGDNFSDISEAMRQGAEAHDAAAAADGANDPSISPSAQLEIALATLLEAHLKGSGDHHLTDRCDTTSSPTRVLNSVVWEEGGRVRGRRVRGVQGRCPVLSPPFHRSRCRSTLK